MGTHPIFESDFDCLTEMGRSRSPTPDVKIEVAQTDQNQTSQNGSNQKRFESVSAVSKAPSDVVLVDEIASSAYAKTFYKSKELEVERMRLLRERERMEKEREEREKLLQPEEPNEEEAMMAMMGFSGFESTQNKQVEGNEYTGAARTQKQRKYRQYM